MEKIDYSELKKLFQQYIASEIHYFTDEQIDLVNELKNKIESLETISDEIVDLTNSLISEDVFAPNEYDVINLFGMELKLKRADPNIPIQLDNVSVAYSKESRNIMRSPEDLEKEKTLERKTTEFYQVAHRVIHIAKILPKLEKFKCDPISIVRNKLIEHPEGGDSKITYDSFAYSKNEGPYVKGLRKNDQLQYMDKGFYSNSTLFVSELKKVLIEDRKNLG